MNKLQKIFRTVYKYKRKISHTLTPTRNNSSKNDEVKLNLLFFGTDDFSMQSLRLLNETRKHSSKINRLDVVTSFKAYGNPIKKFANQNSLKCFGWPITDFDVKENHYDLGVVVSFGHLIPESIIKAFPLGMINVHASLLPKWRGASPIIYSILNDDPVTGVSIMKIEPKKFDIGEILAQSEVNVPKNVLMPELHATLAKEGAQLLVSCINNMPQIFANAMQQNNEDATYAPKVNDTMMEINWKEMSARHIYNIYRALYSFKSLATSWQQHRIKIKEIQINEKQVINSRNIDAVDKLPGTLEYIKRDKCLIVHCVDRKCLVITKLGIEGKRIMSAEDFNNGFLKKVSVVDRHFT